MKKLLLAGPAIAALLAAAPAASASDIGLAGSTYDWSGGYVGVNAGAAFNASEFQSRYRYKGTDTLDTNTEEAIAGLNNNYSPTDMSFTGGALAGYNWQFGNFVVGMEGDFNYLGLDGSSRRNQIDALGGVLTSTDAVASERYEYDATAYGTGRLRLGYAFDNVLVYGTGGFAYGYMNASNSVTGAADTESIGWNGGDDGWEWGWTLGGGIEYGLDSWVLGLEYLYVDLGSMDWSSNARASFTDTATNDTWSAVGNSVSADYRFSVARATLKYRF